MGALAVSQVTSKNPLRFSWETLGALRTNARADQEAREGPVLLPASGKLTEGFLIFGK